MDKQQLLKNVLAAWPTGVAVVTTFASGKRHGMTISSFSALSLDPSLVLWSIRETSLMAGMFTPGRAFSVNILADNQQWVATQFASNQADRFCGVAVTVSTAEVPIICGCKAVIEGVIDTVFPGGDHRIVVGRVGKLSLTEDASPLIYCERRYQHRPAFHCV